MSAKIRWAMLALAVAGLGLSLEALWVHYNLLTDPTYVSPCNVNAQVNCEEVYQSAYGSIAGIPVAFGGVIWFGLVTLLAGFGRPTAPGSHSPHYLLGLSVIGLAVIAYLAYTSFFVLGTGCVLCMGTYVCVLGVAALSKFGSTGSLAAMMEHLGSDLAALPSHGAGFLAGLVFAVVVAWGIVTFPREGAAAEQAAAETSSGITAEARSDFAAAWAAQPRVDLGVPAEGASVVIVKFNDYACPTCRQAEMLYRPVVERFAATNPGAVHYVVKDYPLNASCNVSMQGTIPGHEGSCAAAAAARLATERGRYDEMTAWIWSNQSAQPDAVARAASEILGVTQEEFDQYYLNVLPAIRQDVADGMALNVNATPTYYINGVVLPNGIIPVPYFELAIELEIQRAAEPAPPAA